MKKHMKKCIIKSAGRYEMDMTTGPILPNMIRFAVPLMCSTLLQLLYSAADMIIVGQFAGSEALAAVGETGPYILAPHSMSGLEAIRWKQNFPHEVSAIIGIDMATPLSFSVWKADDLTKTVRLMRVLRGLHVGRFLASVSNLSLTEDEVTQHQLLKKRNPFNLCCINEAKEVLNNAKTVGEDGNISCPTLLFSSNGKDQEKDWVENQQKFAAIMGARLICYDCGHYIHHFKSEEMCEEITRFLHSLKE